MTEPVPTTAEIIDLVTLATETLRAWRRQSTDDTTGDLVDAAVLLTDELDLILSRRVITEP